MTEWTTTPPTEPGWYWHRFSGHRPSAVEIDEYGYEAGVEMNALPVSQWGGKWWPIRIPKPK